MGEKLEGNAHWQLRARQFQRFYHDTPRQKNRDLITAEHLARAKLLQPDYKLPAADDDDDDGEGEEAWPVTWNNPNSLRGTLNHRTWKAYPTKDMIGSTKVRKAAPEPPAAPEPAPEPAQNPPSGSASVPHELEIISEVPLDHLQHQPATGTRPTPTPTTVPPENHHVPDPPQQATAQPTPNGSLSLDPAYPSLPGDLVPAASQPGIPPAELDSRFQDVKRLLSRLVVNAKKPRYDAEPIGNEGVFESGAFPQVTQMSHDGAEPVSNEGSSEGSFSQDDFRTFLAWRRERRAQG